MAIRTLQFVGTIWQEGNMYTAYCPELDLATCGHTVEEARAICTRPSKSRSKRRQIPGLPIQPMLVDVRLHRRRHQVLDGQTRPHPPLEISAGYFQQRHL